MSINFDEQIFGQKMPLKVFVRGGVKIENRENLRQCPNYVATSPPHIPLTCSSSLSCYHLLGEVLMETHLGEHNKRGWVNLF